MMIVILYYMLEPGFYTTVRTTAIERPTVVWCKKLVFLDLNFGSPKYYKLILHINTYILTGFFM